MSGWYNICRVNVSHLPSLFNLSLANCCHHSPPSIPSIPLWHLDCMSGKVMNAQLRAHPRAEGKCIRRTRRQRRCCGNNDWQVSFFFAKMQIITESWFTLCYKYAGLCSNASLFFIREAAYQLKRAQGDLITPAFSTLFHWDLQLIRGDN